tara:strand:- start:2392 stop:2982 length:591 start_codon:yes stop_codon:yes gene_type:complete
MHSFKEFIQLDEVGGIGKGIFNFIKNIDPDAVIDMVGSYFNKPGRVVTNVIDDTTNVGFAPARLNLFNKADEILDHLDFLANGVYDNLGSLFSDFFAMLGEGFTESFDAFRMILRNLIADPDLLKPDAADSMLDYLFDMDMIIEVSEDGTQMFFSHNGATPAQNEVIDTFFNGALASVDGLFEALVDAFPDSLYGG